jgi:hypothetical protein
MTNPSEHDIQSTIIDLIRVRGGVATRINSGSMITKRNDTCYRVQLADKGTSDIIALYKGVYLAIEVKGVKGKASDEQIAFLESVARAGGVGLLAYDSLFVEEALNTIHNTFDDCPMSYRFCDFVIKNPNRLFVECEK